MYPKLVQEMPKHVTKIVRFDWSAVFESFGTTKETCTKESCMVDKAKPPLNGKWIE